MVGSMQEGVEISLAGVLLALAPGVLSSSPALAQCPSTSRELLAHTHATTVALESLDNTALYRATALAREALTCLSEPIRPDAAIAYHQAMALFAFVDTNSAASVSAFQAILWIDPEHRLPPAFLEQPALASAWAEARSRPGSGAAPMSLPQGVRAFIDGREQATIPTDRPAVLQLMDAEGEMIWSEWVAPGGDLDAWITGGPGRCPDGYTPVVGECLEPSLEGPLGYRMQLIPSGAFLAGSPPTEPGRWDDEAQEQVSVPVAFYLGEVEVTQELWRDVMGENPSRFRGATRPVEQVSWLDAVRFANRLSELEGLTPCYLIKEGEVSWPQGTACEGFRLPTESEWEYAARAGSPAPFSAPGEPWDGAWYRENARGHTHRVGTLTPNRYGLYDMSGNVWEWVWDRYERGEGDRTELRGCRGGAWDSSEQGVRVAHRGVNLPDAQRSYLGLRLAITAR
jgi:formylglycine-generating enzyme required for sulfatase activity